MQGEDHIAPQVPQQVAPPAGEPRGYVRLASMDGKTISHRVSYIAVQSKMVFLPGA